MIGEETLTSRKSFRSSRSQTLFFGGMIGNTSAVRRLLVQRNPAALWLMKRCTFPMEITKEGAQRLSIKMRNAGLYWLTILCEMKVNGTLRNDFLRNGTPRNGTSRND